MSDIDWDMPAWMKRPLPPEKPWEKENPTQEEVETYREFKRILFQRKREARQIKMSKEPYSKEVMRRYEEMLHCRFRWLDKLQKKWKINL